MIAGWINCREENRMLPAKLGDRRIRFTDAERHRLAALASPFDRKRLQSFAWFNPRIANSRATDAGLTDTLGLR